MTSDVFVLEKAIDLGLTLNMAKTKGAISHQMALSLGCLANALAKFPENSPHGMLI